ncbi:MAG: hypothetical protein LBU83_03335 [Bacteroidales bacterium]|jgi:hypothetical protein|nr:hypothetical protein [Bacteroidales bacterium]
MNTIFHFESAQEITPTIIDVIKQAYEGRPVSLYIREEEPFVPEWQKEEVRRRDAMMKNNSDYLLDCEMVIDELERELEMA